ncbi:MAG: creatininase family protein [Planctomycetota bacterium]|jgi:creatinine amidohydrolase
MTDTPTDRSDANRGSGLPPRPYILAEANYKQLRNDPPRVAILPWGATEAHNYHLPHGTDTLQANAFAYRSAERAHERGARIVVLPAIPYGNDSQQLDQAATVSISTTTALAILRDVVTSLARQGIDRVLILNAHGGNEFKPLVRDLQLETGSLIVVASFFQMCRDLHEATFDNPGDHADEMETSLLLHLCPEWVVLDQAGDGERVPFEIEGLSQPGVWTPRPWAQSHPDTGSGDPSLATAEKGRAFFDGLCEAYAEVIVGLSNAQKGQLPYL